MSKSIKIFLPLIICLVMTACYEVESTPSMVNTPSQESGLTSEVTPTALTETISTVEPTVSASPIPLPTSTLAPDAWMLMPVIPEAVSPRVMEIYQMGQTLGNDPRAFSRMGDCDSLPFSFLGDFDEGSEAYRLGDYEYLADAIAYFQGSFSRQGAAARDAFNSATALISPWGGDAQYKRYISECLVGESALNCEVRLHKPSFMLIALGTNDFGQPERFERNMRLILDTLIANGVIPILGTKGDNLEGNHRINAIISQLAYEYEIPLWNFWLAIQPLPNHGIRTDDNYHPTHPGLPGQDGLPSNFIPNDFSNQGRMVYAFPWRNLTALQILNLLMNSVIP